jgi:hypothetical protein
MMLHPRRLLWRSPASAPVELRFIDLFMIIVAALLFVVVTVALAGALIPQPGPADRLRVATRSLPVAVECLRYTLHLAARGGTAPYGWRLVEGELPAGLGLHGATGQIAGTPLRPLVCPMTVEVLDARGGAARASLTLEVRARRQGEPLRTEGEVIFLPQVVTFVSYRHRFSATGGRPPVTWRLVEGTLPPGLTLSPDGTVAGTLEIAAVDPRLNEPCRFAVAAEDSEGARRVQHAAVRLRFEPRWSWMKGVEESLTFAFWLVVERLAAPMVLASLAGLLLVVAAGFRGGRAPAWEGLLAWLKRQV